MSKAYLENALKTANQIAAKCEGKSKWEDPDFPCSSKSLYRKKSQNANITSWKRPDDIAKDTRLFVDGVESGDVIQGSLGDCYFLGALAVVATRRDLLLPLFVSARPSVGFYQCKFFKNGQWNVVTIDDRLPVNSQNQLVFAHCKDKNEMWVPLLEKAYAKIHGYYEAIESGSISSALMDLTGEASQSFDFHQGEGGDLIKSNKFWDLLTFFEKEKYLMGCSCKRGGIETDTGKGILGNHAYSILQCVQVSAKDRLLRIRNPWGCKEWTGRWSDGSKEWTSALKSKLKFEFADDGTFFMCYEDFVDQFDNLFVCRLLTDQVGHVYHHLTFEHDWNKQTAGGCSNHETWRNNDQWAITVTKKSDSFICLIQPDQRMITGKEEYTASIGFNIYKADNSRKINSPDPDKLFHKCSYAPGRHVASLVNFDPGEYILVPTTFAPGQQMTYYLHTFAYHTIKVDLIGDGPGNAAAYITGKWSGKTAGGCFNHTSWINNPKYLLKFAKNTGNYDVEIILVQSAKGACFIGLYLFGGYQDGKGLAQNQCVKQIQCTNKNEVTEHLSLPASGGAYVVMPITFKPGEVNEFQLIIHTKEKVALYELEGVTAKKVPDYVPKANVKQPSGYAITISGGILKVKSDKPKAAAHPHKEEHKKPKPYEAPVPKAKPFVPPVKASAAPSRPSAPKQASPRAAHRPPPKPSKTAGTGSQLLNAIVTPRVSRDHKGDVILSVNVGTTGGSKQTKTKKETHTVVGSDGKKVKQTTVTTTTTTFVCGGCGATQIKGSKGCTRCGARFK